MRLRLDPVEHLGDVRREWRTLAERAGNPFLTWEWASTWWRHFGRGRSLRVTACRTPDGEVRAILPLYESAVRPVRVLRFLGHGPGDHLGLVCAPDDRAQASWALRRALTVDPRPWDLFVAERLPADERWDDAVGGTVLARESSPTARLGHGWEGYLSTRSGHLRKRLRYLERRLRREHEVGYRLCADPSRLERDMATLFALHASRWRAHASGALDGARQPFHAEFAAQALARGWLRLWFLELDGRPVAAWYGLRLGGTEFYYQAGRDPAFDRWSVGLVLLAHTIRAAAEDGMREYRLLRGGEGYKERFADADPGLETRILARGAAGRVAAAAAGPLLRRSRADHGRAGRIARRGAVRLAGRAT